MNSESTRGGDGTSSAGDDARGASHDETAPPMSVVFDALSNRRSRNLLYHLIDESGGPVTVDGLAAAIARREVDDADATPDDAALERVRATLHHKNLPKLADASLLLYDEGTSTVRLNGSSDRIEPYLSLSRQADER